MSYSRTISFSRGSEEWELEAEFLIEGPDPDVGVFGSYCVLERLEFFAPHAVWMARKNPKGEVIPHRQVGRWLPFAITSAEREAIEIRASEDYEPAFGDDW